MPRETSKKRTPEVRKRKSRLRDRVTDPFSGPKTAAEIRAAAAQKRAHKKRLLEAATMAEEVRFYNRADAEARIEYWARREWTADQATALSFQKEPDIVNYQSVVPLEPVWTFSREYSERFELIHRLYRREGWIVGAPLWLVKKSPLLGFEFPARLIKAIEIARDTEFAHRSREATPEEIEDLRRQVAKLTLERDQARQETANAKDALIREQANNPNALRSHMAIAYALALKTKFSLDRRSGAATTIFELLANTPARLHRDTIHDRLADAMARFSADDSV